MRINANSNLTKQDVYAAAAYARSKGHDIHVQEISVSPRGAITVYCESMNGNRAVNRPQTGYFANDRVRAASWTAWGWLIADLFMKSPNAKIGYYKGVEDFREQCRRWVPRGANLKFLRHLPRPKPDVCHGPYNMHSAAIHCPQCEPVTNRAS